MSSVRSRSLAGFPGFVMAGCLFAQASGGTILRSSTSASLSWRGETNFATQSTTGALPVEEHEILAAVVVKDAINSLNLATLSKTVFPESRRMEDWERKATDEFFSSLFS